MTPKKVLKKIYKKILKSSGQFAPHKFKRQRKPTTFVVGFYYLKKVISDITLKQLE